MDERVRNLNEYYTVLGYNKDNKEALEKISTLSKELNFKNFNSVAHRFCHAASLIEKHLDLFKSVCEHVDVITTILDSLHYFGTSAMLGAECDVQKKPIISIILTINNMYMEKAMQLFLETALIPKSHMEMYCHYKKIAQRHLDGMILLEDSDLYAVINCLKFKNVRHNLDKIWIEKSIVNTFKWHYNKCFGRCVKFPIIETFESKETLPTSTNYKRKIFYQVYEKTRLHIISIWSEDIMAAKNLAESLNQDITFINAHMEFCSVIFPYIDKYIKSLTLSLKLDQSDKYIAPDTINLIDTKNYKGLSYNHFYRGEWKKPNFDTYWIHNKILLANATLSDGKDCAISAMEGFEVWSTMSSKSRMRILSTFANILKENDKIDLAITVLSWINLAYIRGSLKHYYQDERFEIIKIRKPQGIVILKEKDENILFQELIQSLIIGNSIIVLCDPNLCALAPYCDMFKISGIPSGVINLLIGEKLNFRCDTINNETLDKLSKCVTTIEHIIVSRK